MRCMKHMSLKQKEFGTNKICLYQAILDEWLHGSSRENKMIAYAGDFLAKEMECPLAKARKAAEKCLEFWLQRGILDKGIHANEAK